MALNGANLRQEKNSHDNNWVRNNFLNYILFFHSSLVYSITQYMDPFKVLTGKFSSQLKFLHDLTTRKTCNNKGSMAKTRV